MPRTDYSTVRGTYKLYNNKPVSIFINVKTVLRVCIKSAIAEI